MGSEKEVGVLVEAVKKEDGSLAGRNVAQAAITALGAIGGVNAAKALEDIWRDERMSRGCREVTLSALGTAGDPGAMDILENVLAGEQESLRDDAAEGLGEIGKHNSQEPIIVNRVAGSLRAHLWDQNPRVRVSSTYARGWIGGKDDVQLLEGLLEDDYRRIVNYSENGEVMEKETFPVRDKAKEAIDRILARVGAGGDR
jgi:HEAT repeat protein